MDLSAEHLEQCSIMVIFSVIRSQLVDERAQCTRPLQDGNNDLSTLNLPLSGDEMYADEGYL